jgi:bacteriocin biosynthesis cyclodehydratase domain-containing protein
MTGVKPHASPWMRAAFDDEGATLTVGRKSVRYGGAGTRLLRHVLPVLDGTAEPREIAARLGAPELAPAIDQLCRRLAADGMLVDGGEAVRPGSLFEAMHAGPGAAVDPVGRLLVIGDSAEVDAVAAVSPPTWSVRAASFDDVGAGDATNRKVIVWTANPNDPRLDGWNRNGWAERIAWLPICHFDGEAATVGPFVLPPETPCFECYRRRRAAQSAVGVGWLRGQAVSTVPSTTAALTTVLAAIAVTAVHEWSVRRSPYVPGAVKTVRFDRGLSLDTEYVLKAPRCPACRPLAAHSRPALWTDFVFTGTADA